jgi:hypothetical protein
MNDHSRSKPTRRGFVVGAIPTSIASAAALPSYRARAGQSGSESNPAAAVDQNPIRRRGVGLRALDPARASPGFTLFSPMRGDGMVYLVDLHGRVAHTWKMPYPPGLYGYLTPSGTLFYNGKIPNDSFLGKAPFKGGAVMEADWKGRILWQLREPNHHHDGRLLRSGNVLLLCAAELPNHASTKVQGGRPGTEVNGKIWADYLLERTKDGKTVWEWRTWEYLDPSEHKITAPQDERSEWTHGNAIIELPDGNLLVSFRNISTVIKIDRKTSFPFSRVIEVDPATKEIVWKYEEFPFNFYSPRVSNAQRLSNGNTLINEGSFGRFFEVTRDGEVVWEYVNPYFGPASAAPKAPSNTVFRAYRYTDEEVAKGRSTG